MVTFYPGLWDVNEYLIGVESPQTSDSIPHESMIDSKWLTNHDVW